MTTKSLLWKRSILLICTLNSTRDVIVVNFLVSVRFLELHPAKRRVSHVKIHKNVSIANRGRYKSRILGKFGMEKVSKKKQKKNKRITR